MQTGNIAMTHLSNGQSSRTSTHTRTTPLSPLKATRSATSRPGTTTTPPASPGTRPRSPRPTAPSETTSTKRGRPTRVGPSSHVSTTRNGEKQTRATRALRASEAARRKRRFLAASPGCWIFHYRKAKPILPSDIRDGMHRCPFPLGLRQGSMLDARIHPCRPLKRTAATKSFCRTSGTRTSTIALARPTGAAAVDG